MLSNFICSLASAAAPLAAFEARIADTAVNPAHTAATSSPKVKTAVAKDDHAATDSTQETPFMESHAIYSIGFPKTIEVLDQ